jgi:hypothetical protein
MLYSADTKADLDRRDSSLLFFLSGRVPKLLEMRQDILETSCYCLNGRSI